jgi:hypothetical protein
MADLIGDYLIYYSEDSLMEGNVFIHHPRPIIGELIDRFVRLMVEVMWWRAHFLQALICHKMALLLAHVII